MAPLTVEDVESVSWDQCVDVVVVGFGGAGASAALEARGNGAEVLVLDRFGGGGTTKYSGGVIYAGATRFQREAGLPDSIDNMHAYLKLEVGDAVRPETLRRFCEGSADDVEWLVGHGVEYASDVFLEKITYPPEGKYLYYSGNEKSPSFAAQASPAPRGHRAVGPGFGGTHYIAALRRAIERQGVTLSLHTRVTRLVVDAEGRVCGVEAMALPTDKHAEQQALYEGVSPYVPHNHKRTDQAKAAMQKLEEQFARKILIRARGGVILSTGGFAYGRALIGAHDPVLAQHYDVSHRLSTMGNDGSGVEMGMSAGGATDRMDSMYIARNIAPPEALLEGILINGAGERFVAEDAYVSLIGGKVARQPQGKAWLVVRAKDFRRSIRESLTCGWQRFKYFGVPMLVNYAFGGTRRGSTASSLARKLGIDPATFLKTIDMHDRDIADRRPDLVGKTDVLRTPLGRGPFYAINMSMDNRHALTKFMTLGGLTVDEGSGGVTRIDGSPVKGLYAAGMSAVGLHSNGYISGLSLADGVFSGRRAGRNAANAAAGAPVDRSIADAAA